jgi:hypothetical protein
MSSTGKHFHWNCTFVVQAWFAEPQLGRASEACRQVLENDDILQQIFEEFDMTGELNGDDNSNRHSLLSAALSSTSLLGSSLDMLWKTMPSLIPFLKLFSSFQEVNGVNVRFMFMDSLGQLI